MDPVQKITSILLECLPIEVAEGLSKEFISKKIESPKDSKMGDLAFPCFLLAKAMKKAPPMIANELLAQVEEKVNQSELLEKVIAAGPYLNFFISNTHLAQIIPAILDGDYLNPEKSKNEKVMIEYSQPNTHKAFHVGHMRNVALGDSLSRLYKYAGYDVMAVNYIGDEGTHIAKCLWAYQNLFDGEVPDDNRGEFLGDLYAKADEYLDLSAMTKYPFPDYICAEITEIKEHPNESKWKVLKLNAGSTTNTVVCGGDGYEIGNKVVYAMPNSKLGGRFVIEKDMKGVTSQGCICSEGELGISDQKNKIFILDQNSTVGTELCELGKLEAFKDTTDIVELWKSRNNEVSEVLKKLEDKTSDIQKLWSETKEWSLNDFKSIYSWVNCDFDHYFYESEVGESGKEVVLKALDEGKLIKSEGAVGADLEKEKLGFFMLLKSDGTGLYSTKDIALAQLKFEQYKIDRSIYVVDFSQSLHFKQVFKTLELLGYEKAQNCYHLPYGLVMLPDGKMSSRKGNVITFSKLKNSLEKHILENYLDRHDDWNDEEKIEATRTISVATIRYGMLNQDNIKNIIFDMDAWTAVNGNTGPYLLYAYARTQSVLRKGENVNATQIDLNLLVHDAEKTLLTDLGNFKTMSERSTVQNKPQLICIYLYQLSKNFSRFFENCPVLKAESDTLVSTRLALTRATGKVLKQGLSLLGINTLQRM
jgi:arginyl-tRNA synthetase